MSSIWGSKRSKVKANCAASDPAPEPGVHIYLFWTKEGERFLSHTAEEATAEELCIRAAKVIGEPRPSEYITALSVCVCTLCTCCTVFDLTLTLYSPGINPLCHVLFALYNPQSRCWYSPKHIFRLEDASSLVLHYRMRWVCDVISKNTNENTTIKGRCSAVILFFFFSPSSL